MRRALAAALIAATIAAPAAGAKTIRVSWNEQRRLHDGTFAFHVSRIDAKTTSWSAVVSIANHTKTGSASSARAPGAVTTSALLARHDPRERAAARGIYLRLTFGYFVPGRPGTRSKCDPQRGFAPFDNTTWYWTTDHTFRL